ncbi:MAG: DUF3098 domain-containing protein [Bacteroidetes bacterium]|nr:DUF3098 domain-containing protein [Bacteroidota bacterium]
MDKNKKPVTAKKPAETAKPAPTAKLGEFAFGKENYRLMLIGLFFIALGFLLMIGGGTDDPKVFSYDLFSFRRITLSPILILAGYVIEIFAIMKKPRD